MKMKLLSITVALGLSINALAQIPTVGLVAYYPFTGNANDFSGNNLNGIVTGAILTTDRFGNANSAYSFNGSTDNISITTNSLLDFQTANKFSLSYWINPTSLSISQLNVILSKQTGSGSSQDGWNSNIEINSNKYRIQNGTSSSSCTFSAASPIITSNLDYHIVQIYDNGTSSIYINGVLADQTSCTALIGGNSSNLLIGNATWTNINTKGFTGKIDDIAIYNRVLTSTEVTQIYTGCIQPSQASTPTGTTQLCVNPANSNYSTIGSTNATAYTWELLPSGAGTITGTTTTAIIDWNSTYTGTATIKVKGTNGTCIGAFSNTLSVTINQLPTVTLSSLTPVCSNATPFSLTGGTPSGGVYSGTGVSGNSFSPSVAGVGTFSVIYSYTDGNACLSSASQNLTVNFCSGSSQCFTTPDGTDGSNWSYKDFIIPTGYQLDSVFMDATRPGYATSNYDFVLASCHGTTTYNNSIVTYPFDYNAENNSLYNIWIDLTSFNYTSVGMVRVSLPTNAGAVWNQVCFAISPLFPNCGILTDTRDGQQYQTVTIGTQCWMRQNLNYGTQVADVSVMTNNSTVEKACYNNTTSNCTTYGGIYTWDEAMNYGTAIQGICPNGWHIPSQADFQILINYLGSSTAGQKMKATSFDAPAWDGTNTSGFTAIPGGIGQGANYLYMGQRDTYWSSTAFSSTDAYDYDLSSGTNTLVEAPNTKNSGYCIRCIQDNITTYLNSNKIENNNSFFPNPTSGVVSITGIRNETIIVYNSIGQIIIQTNKVNTIDLSTYNRGLYFIQIINEGGVIINSSKILKE